jgi:hypothetical protein
MKAYIFFIAAIVCSNISAMDYRISYINTIGNIDSTFVHIPNNVIDPMVMSEKSYNVIDDSIITTPEEDLILRIHEHERRKNRKFTIKRTIRTEVFKSKF